MANVITLKVVYKGCENKIWREMQISSNALSCQLGYAVLATFNTMACHLFAIEHNGTSYELPSDDQEILPEKCLLCVKLSDLKLSVGDKLEMLYDFGCEQRFDMEVTDITPMPRGAGRAYPKILSGEGRGIIDDMSAEDLCRIIQDIDQYGGSTVYYAAKRPAIPWDYRKYDIQLDNDLLKTYMQFIAEGYAEFEEFLAY